MAGTQLLSSMVQPQNPNCLVGPQTSTSQQDGRTQILTIMVGPQLQLSTMRQTTQLSAHIVHSQLPTDSLSKSSNSQEHRFWAWRHSHCSPIFYLWFIMWCNGYRRRKWTRRHEFKSWTRLIAFHIALIPLGKLWILLFSLQLWVNSRAV